MILRCDLRPHMMAQRNICTGKERKIRLTGMRPYYLAAAKRNGTCTVKLLEMPADEALKSHRCDTKALFELVDERLGLVECSVNQKDRVVAELSAAVSREILWQRQEKRLQSEGWLPAYGNTEREKKYSKLTAVYIYLWTSWLVPHILYLGCLRL